MGSPWVRRTTRHRVNPGQRGRELNAVNDVSTVQWSIEKSTAQCFRVHVSPPKNMTHAGKSSGNWSKKNNARALSEVYGGKYWPCMVSVKLCVDVSFPGEVGRTAASTPGMENNPFTCDRLAYWYCLISKTRLTSDEQENRCIPEVFVFCWLPYLDPPNAFLPVTTHIPISPYFFGGKR